MISAAIAFWVPIASMVMIAPLMSTSRRSSGIAVISLDFSAQATCPSDRPNSLAQTLTECRAPRPFLRSWLRRAVLPSIGRTGRSTPVRRGRRRAERVQPVREAGLEGRRLQGHQDAAEDVLAGDPVGQVQRLDEELLLRGGPLGDGGRAAGAGQHRHHGDDDHTDQGMSPIDRGAGVLQLREVEDDFIEGDALNIGHRRPSLGDRVRGHRETGIPLNVPKRKHYILPGLPLEWPLALSGRGCDGDGKVSQVPVKPVVIIRHVPPTPV